MLSSHFRTIVLRAAVAASTTLIGASVAAAQGTTAAPHDSVPGWHRGGKGHMGDLAAKLNLSADQKTKIQAIHAKYQPQFQAARKAIEPDMQAARTARQQGDTAAVRAAMQRVRDRMQSLKPLHEQEQAEIRALLTPQQQQQFDALKANRGKHLGKFRGKGERGKGHDKTAPTGTGAML